MSLGLLISVWPNSFGEHTSRMEICLSNEMKISILKFFKKPNYEIIIHDPVEVSVTNNDTVMKYREVWLVKIMIMTR